MATYEQIERVLQDSVDASKALKVVISEAHAAKKDLEKTVKAQRDLITEQIIAAVADQVGVISEEARAEMRGRVAAVIDDLAERWRLQLGLTQ